LGDPPPVEPPVCEGGAVGVAAGAERLEPPTVPEKEEDEDEEAVAPVSPPVVVDVVLGDVVLSFALLGRAVKCLRKGFLLTSWSSRLRYSVTPSCSVTTAGSVAAALPLPAGAAVSGGGTVEEGLPSNTGTAIRATTRASAGRSILRSRMSR
jgi:hypothetical protein